MLTTQNLKNLLFFDIETVTNFPSYDKLHEYSSELSDLWDLKVSQKYKDDNKTNDEIYIENAGLYPEFGKIICISVGYIDKDGNTKLKTYNSESEVEILTEFKTVLEAFYNIYKNTILCNHNILGFDIPYIIRRMFINNISIPNLLKIHFSKPWDLKIIDTMKIWQSGNKDNVSLKLIANSLGIKHSKDIVDSSKLSYNYWNKKVKLNTIKEYCEGDVNTVIEICKKLTQLI